MRNLVNNIKDDKQLIGILTEYSNFCEKKFTCEKCQEFYNKLKELEDGKYICPYDFCCIKSKGKIYNGLIVKELCNIAKLRQKLKEKFKVYSESEINELIKIDDELNENEYEKSLIEINVNNLLHDITKANNLIKDKLEKVDKSLINKVLDRKRVTSSYYLSDFVRLRSELYKTIVNPEIAKIGAARKREAYKIWDIYRHIFNEIGDEKNITISMKTYDYDTELESENATTFFVVRDSVSTLPFLIFDNAIKYSPEDSTIYVSMYQKDGNLRRIEILNTTSYNITEDPNLFFDRGYRSKANTSKSSGSGLGLNIAKQICDSNDIDIQLSIKYTENGNQEFVMSLNFK